MAIYLKVDAIIGDVSAKGYEKSMDIISYRLAGKRPIHQKTGMLVNRTSGLLQYKQGIDLSKVIDNGSIKLLQYLYQAKTLPKIEFHHVSTGTSPRCYLVNTYYDVLISDHEEYHSEARSVETFSMHFLRHEKRFMPFDKSHRSTSPQSVGFDLEKVEMI